MKMSVFGITAVTAVAVGTALLLTDKKSMRKINNAVTKAVDDTVSSVKSTVNSVKNTANKMSNNVSSSANNMKTY